MSASALGARALLFLQQTELEPQQDTRCVITPPQQQQQQQHQQQQQQQQPVSGSNLLAKRRTRSRNSNSSCYELSLLSIPPSAACQTQHNSRAITGQSEQVKHVQSVERDASEIAAVCLRLMVMRRLTSSEHVGQAEEFLRETGGGGLNGCAQELPAGSAGATTSATTSGAPTPSDTTDRGVGGCSCMNNVRLARRLASMADEFGQSWCGRQAVDCASRMELPPALRRTEFDSHLAGLLIHAGSVRSKVSFLLVLSAELAVKAALLLNRMAIITLLEWCQELLCSMASAFIVVRGWASLLGDEDGPLATVATVLALVLIGCSLARLFTRNCRK